MSKLTKFLKSPKLFFEDAKINSKAQKVMGKGNTASAPSTSEKTSLKIVPGPTATVAPAVSGDKPKAAAKEMPEKSTSAVKVRNDDLVLTKKLLDFEAIYPVNNVKSENPLVYPKKVLLWPFIRHVLWVRCQAFYKGKAPDKVSTTKMYISLEWQKHYNAIADIKNVDELDKSECDFLFFTNLRGTEQTKINNKIYNRITDPVFEVAKKIGVSKKVEIIKSIGNITENRFRFHPVDLLYPPLLRTVGYRELLDIPENFIARTKEFLPEVKITEDNLRTEFEFFFHQRDFYISILQKYNPKVVFFIGFDYHYALILAAKTLGIKTVDLQHGVQAGWSPVYNNWQTIPVGGYEMLPDYFWVWGEYDEDKIKENFPVSSVKPIIGGFPWLERQKEFFVDQQKKLKEWKKGNKDKIPTGLITLQDQTEFPAIFSNIIFSTKDQIKWVIKRHPKHLGIKLNKVLNNAYFGKYYDELNLQSLLENVDIHLTECSTSVIDADYFGVPSVVTGAQGVLNYKDFIDRKIVFHVNNEKEFIDKLPIILGAKGASKMKVVNNNGTTEQALYELLKTQA